MDRGTPLPQSKNQYRLKMGIGIRVSVEHLVNAYIKGISRENCQNPTQLQRNLNPTVVGGWT